MSTSSGRNADHTQWQTTEHTTTVKSTVSTSTDANHTQWQVSEQTQQQQTSLTVHTPPQLHQQPIQPIQPNPPPTPRLAHVWPVWPVGHLPLVPGPVTNGQHYLNPINPVVLNQPVMPQLHQQPTQANQQPAPQLPWLGQPVPVAQGPVPNDQQYLNPINPLSLNHPAMPQSQLLPPPMHPPPQQLYFTIWLRPGSQAAVGNITVPGNTTVYDLLRNHCPHGRPHFWDASHRRQCVPEHSKTVESLVHEAAGQEHVYVLIEG
ncbi:hypothetical protein LTR56_027011 [Elasticomyces elasticus]|nr:hypothetical protein LTR56_027011 [Elasticomyces elasticus]KAK4921236.1 hypothetical protein LTR49_011239 [Elasticomyces elasticus]KAK5735128.1 hypothetical protein LTS12_026546 [Elasticomyces elasticus]